MDNYLSTVTDKKTFIEINDETDDLSISIKDEEIISINENYENYSIGQFNHTAMGGSFDHPHVGHKVIYSLF